MLQKQKSRLLKYGHSVTYAKRLGAESKLTMALAYNADIALLKLHTGQTDWEYVIPEEGSIMWVDCLALPS